MIKKLIIFFVLFSICNSCFAGVDFDGDDAMYGDDLGTHNAGTIALWVNGDGFDSTYWQGIFSGIYASGYYYEIFSYGDGTISLVWNVWKANVNNDTWYHVLIKWDGTNVSAYLDGVSVGSTGDAHDWTFPDPALGVYADALYFDGTISEFYMWDTALTQTEITILAKSKVKGIGLQIQPTNLITYLPMDDAADGVSADSKVFIDRSGNGNPFTAYDGANDAGCLGKGEEVLSYP